MTYTNPIYVETTAIDAVLLNLIMLTQSLSSNLCYNRQAGVDNARLANIKDEVWILYNVYPESQWQTEKKKIINSGQQEHEVSK